MDDLQAAYEDDYLISNSDCRLWTPGFCVVGGGSSAQRRAQMAAVAVSTVERMKSAPCALMNTKNVSTAVERLSPATTSTEGCVVTVVPRLATMARCEATSVPGPRFEVQPG